MKHKTKKKYNTKHKTKKKYNIIQKGGLAFEKLRYFNIDALINGAINSIIIKGTTSMLDSIPFGNNTPINIQCETIKKAKNKISEKIMSPDIQAKIGSLEKQVRSQIELSGLMGLNTLIGFIPIPVFLD